MTLYDQFIKLTQKHGANMENLYHEKEDGFEFVTFGENAKKDEDALYSISLAFFDDNDMVEMFIRKKVDVNDELSVYRKINDLNLNYRGVTFIYINGMLCLKSFCSTGGDVSVAIKLLSKNMDVAQDLFREFIGL